MEPLIKPQVDRSEKIGVTDGVRTRDHRSHSPKLILSTSIRYRNYSQHEAALQANEYGVENLYIRKVFPRILNGATLD